jgi:hypothetical protein
VPSFSWSGHQERPLVLSGRDAAAEPMQAEIDLFFQFVRDD